MWWVYHSLNHPRLTVYQLNIKTANISDVRNRCQQRARVIYS